MQTEGVRESWMMQIHADLRNHNPNQGSVNGGDSTATIFRVPIPLREVSEESYTPKFFSFGLYCHETTIKDSSLTIFRKDFAKIFMNMTERGWDQIRLAVVGDSVEDWVKFYGDFKLEHPVADTLADEMTTLLALDAVFVVCFIQGDHQRVCRPPQHGQRDCPSLLPLDEEMKKAALRPLVHLIRLDIFRFENQIPLRLLQNVVGMMFNEKRRTNQPFKEFLEDAVDLIYCLPRHRVISEFKRVLKARDLTKCSHLLQCLYSVVCYDHSKSSLEGNTNAQDAAQSIPPVEGNTATEAEPPSESPHEEDTAPTAEAQLSPAPADQGVARWRSGWTWLIPIGTRLISIADWCGGWVWHIPIWTRLVSIIEKTDSNESAGGDGRTTAPGQGYAGPQEGNSAGDLEVREEQAPRPVPHSEQVDQTEPEIVAFAQQSGNGGGGVQGGQALLVQATTHSNRENASRRNTAENANLGNVPDSASTKFKSPIDRVISKFKPAFLEIAPRFRCLRLQWPEQLHNHSLHIATVTQLKDAGITVSVGHGKFVANWISEVNFQSTGCNGILYLPQFSVYDETEILLRNLLAYEYVVEKRKDLLSYIHLMDNLINTEEDVKLMRESGVLENNSLGSDKALADMWNKMLTGIVVDLNKQYQHQVFDKIRKHYDRKWNKLCAEFQGLYLRRPWLFGGTLLLLLTALATGAGMIYTILSYYYGNKNR